jgi:hypothetical protein
MYHKYKNIYSFNFQKAAVDLLVGVLEYHRKQFLRDLIIAGIFVDLRQFLIL